MLYIGNRFVQRVDFSFFFIDVLSVIHHPNGVKSIVSGHGTLINICKSTRISQREVVADDIPVALGG